jgi:hypothetical protein
MKIFRKKIKKSKLYNDYVQVLNGVLQLSYRESEVFSLLLKINDEMRVFIEAQGDILATDIRRIIIRETRISKTNLSKYLDVLKEKDILVPTGNGKWGLNDIFIPEITDGKVEITFSLETDVHS